MADDRALVVVPVRKAVRSGKDLQVSLGSIDRAESRRGVRRAAVVLAAYLFLMAGSSGPAFAHTAERGFVLTLPTGLYIAGGTIVVAVSFLLVALVPAANLRMVERAVWRAGHVPEYLLTTVSLISFVAMIALVLAGPYGTQDPLANPLSLAVWTLWWVGLTMAHALFGNLWSALNPWHGIYVLLGHVPILARWIDRPPLRYPEWLGHWPAVGLFLGFVWFELIFTVPQNPEILANVVAAYVLLTLVGMLLFGEAAWMRHAEAFSVFFRVVSWLSPLNGRPDQGGTDSAREVFVTLPGLGLLRARPLAVSGVAFVLLMLSSVSFDGLSKTYWWLARTGINPLDFPGRSAVALPNTWGLLATFAALMVCYGLAVWLGYMLAGRPGHLANRLRGDVVAIVPIALGYHFAHYLTAFLVDVQYAAITFSDPFGWGWNLLGIGDVHVTTSFLTNFDSVRRIWHCQIASIVIAHVVAVTIAHLIALGRARRRRSAIISQLPMTILMIGYTQFGLWLLSAPAIG
jgi:hypothetical protein